MYALPLRTTLALSLVAVLLTVSLAHAFSIIDYNTTKTTTVTYQCSDGKDNDGDGLVDFDDPGCTDEDDDNEYNLLRSTPPGMQSVVWNSQNLPSLEYLYSSIDSFYNRKPNSAYYDVNQTLQNAIVSILYAGSVWEVDASGAKIRVLSSGESVLRGTRILYEFKPHEYTDITWSGTGDVSDTPYGQWIAGAALPPKGYPICGINNQNFRNYNLYKDLGKRLLYAVLSVNPPTKYVEFNNASPNCSTWSDGVSKVCMMNEVGLYEARMIFDKTYANFYASFRHSKYRGENDYGSCDVTGVRPMYLSTRSPYSLAVPQQTITHTLTVTPTPENPEAHAPTSPSLTSGGACVIGTPHTVSFVSTDPDNDNVRYGIDWDGDGSVNEWVPPSGYVASGASQSASRTYSVAGEKTVKVMAEDEGGLTSDWATLTFSCTETPPPAGQCSDNADNDGDGLIDSLDPDCSATAGLSEFSQGQQPSPPPFTSVDLTLRVIPSLVVSGRPTKVHWSTTGFQSCSVSAPNGDNWEGFSSPVGGQTSSPIRGETTYTLACIDSAGITVTREATVRVAPTWRER